MWEVRSFPECYTFKPVWQMWKCRQAGTVCGYVLNFISSPILFPSDPNSWLHLLFTVLLLLIRLASVSGIPCWTFGLSWRMWLTATLVFQVSESSFVLGWWKCSKIRLRWWLHNSVTILKATDVYTLNVWILWYMNNKYGIWIQLLKNQALDHWSAHNKKNSSLYF